MHGLPHWNAIHASPGATVAAFGAPVGVAEGRLLDEGAVATVAAGSVRDVLVVVDGCVGAVCPAHAPIVEAMTSRLAATDLRTKFPLTRYFMNQQEPETGRMRG
jgi:hypothetical protein